MATKLKGRERDWPSSRPLRSLLPRDRNSKTRLQLKLPRPRSSSRPLSSNNTTHSHPSLLNLSPKQHDYAAVVNRTICRPRKSLLRLPRARALVRRDLSFHSQSLTSVVKRSRPPLLLLAHAAKLHPPDRSCPRLLLADVLPAKLFPPLVCTVNYRQM